METPCRFLQRILKPSGGPAALKAECPFPAAPARTFDSMAPSAPPDFLGTILPFSLQ